MKVWLLVADGVLGMVDLLGVDEGLAEVFGRCQYSMVD